MHSEKGFSEELFSFDGGINNASMTSSGGSLSAIQNDMSDEAIQSAIGDLITQKTLKDSKGDILVIPPLYLMGRTYEEFKQNKAQAFFMLYVHPFFNNKFDVEDIRSVYNSTVQRTGRKSLSTVFTISAMYVGSSILMKRNPIVGLTYSTGGLSFLMRYYLFPRITTDLADSYIFYPAQQQHAANVMRKYDLESEIQSNPICERAYNDIMKYQQSNINKQMKQLGLNSSSSNNESTAQTANNLQMK